MSTTFSRIVAGELPADVVYQDDRVTAFRDINPAAPTHILIVPNREIPTVNVLPTRTRRSRATCGSLHATWRRAKGSPRAATHHARKPRPSGTEARTATKNDVERLEALIATKADRADLSRALWIQGGGIVAILTALKFLP